MYSLSRTILSDLAPMIRKKQAEFTLASLGDLMFLFAAADMTHDRPFFYYLEKQAEDQLTTHEKFTTLNSTRLLWGFGRFVARGLQPRFNNDIGASVLNRFEFSRVPSVNHRIHRRVAEQISAKKKAMTPENMALTLYANASVGFYDSELVTEGFNQFKASGKVPSLQNLGYFAQAMALLRRDEHTAQILDWLEALIREAPT